MGAREPFFDDLDGADFEAGALGEEDFEEGELVEGDWDDGALEAGTALPGPGVRHPQAIKSPAAKVADTMC